MRVRSILCERSHGVSRCVPSASHHCKRGCAAWSALWSARPYLTAADGLHTEHVSIHQAVLWSDRKPGSPRLLPFRIPGSGARTHTTLLSVPGNAWPSWPSPLMTDVSELAVYDLSRAHPGAKPAPSVQPAQEVLQRPPSRNCLCAGKRSGGLGAVWRPALRAGGAVPDGVGEPAAGPPQVLTVPLRPPAVSVLDPRSLA